MAKLVYEISDDKECPKKLGEFLTSQGCTEVKWFDRWITQAVGYVRGGHRCLVFRGTQQKQDWMIDALCFYYGSPPRHFGFHRAWANVRTEVFQWLQSAESSSRGVFLAGHSLGAATAVVAALDLAKQNTNKIGVERVVLFGCPRVGPYEFWKRYDDQGLHQKTDRFEHEDDGICVIPPPMLFMHVGRAPVFVPTQTFVNPPFVSALAGVGTKPATVPSTLAAEATKVLQSDSPFQAILLNTLLATIGMVGYLWLLLVQKFPDSLWLNPTKVTLSRRYPVLGCLLFALVFVAAHLLFSIGPYSSRFVVEIHKSSPLSMLLFLITTVLEAIVVQQASYCALVRIPTFPRLLLSILVAGLVFWFFPVRQIEAVVVPVLALLVVLILPVIYRAAGGSPAHSSELYAKAFSDTVSQQWTNQGLTPEASPDLARFFLMMERIARDPQTSAYFDEALSKIRRNKA